MLNDVVIVPLFPKLPWPLNCGIKVRRATPFVDMKPPVGYKAEEAAYKAYYHFDRIG